MSSEQRLSIPPIFEQDLSPTMDLRLLVQDATRRAAYWKLFVASFIPSKEQDVKHAATSQEYATSVYRQLKAKPELVEHDEIGELLMAAVQDPACAKEFYVDYEQLPWKTSRIAQDAYRLAGVVIRQEEMKAQEEIVQCPGYAFRLMEGARAVLPDDFLQDPYTYGLAHAKILKHEPDPTLEEIIWKMPGSTDSFVIKMIQRKKKNMPSDDYELRVLQRAKMLDLPAPMPLGLIEFENDGPAFMLMKFERGKSGLDLFDYLTSPGDAPEQVRTDAEADATIERVTEQMRQLAERFRRTMWIDKKWYLKDVLLHFNDDGDVTDVFPLDWELARPYNPMKPLEVDSLEKDKRRRAGAKKAPINTYAAP